MRVPKVPLEESSCYRLRPFISWCTVSQWMCGTNYTIHSLTSSVMFQIWINFKVDVIHLPIIIIFGFIYFYQSHSAIHPSNYLGHSTVFLRTPWQQLTPWSTNTLVGKHWLRPSGRYLITMVCASQAHLYFSTCRHMYTHTHTVQP